MNDLVLDWLERSAKRFGWRRDRLAQRCFRISSWAMWRDKIL